MIRSLLAFVCFLLIFCSANCQNLSKQYVDNWVSKSDAAFKVENAGLYVLNGIPYENVKIDSLLQAVPSEKLAGIDYISPEEAMRSFPFGERPSYAIIISTKKKQARKWRKSELKVALSKYPAPNYYTTDINPTSAEPALVINDKQVFHSDCYKELSKIKVGNIEFINIATHAAPSEYYGQNAKNGLIQVWTYNKK